MTFDASDIVRLVLWVILGAFVLSLILALALNKTAKARWTWSLGVVTLFGCVLAFGYYLLAVKPRQIAAQEAAEKGRLSEQEFKERYAKAKALFDERCKTAGEKVYRTVENVEGVLLLDIRSNDKAGQRGNPNWPDAGLPHEVGGDGYIRHFLYWEHNGRPDQRGYLNSIATNATSRGYKFVDVSQADGRTVRYTLADPDSSAPKLNAEAIGGRRARYSVGFENFVDPVDRKFWVAGTKVTITDSSTGELLAEKIWYSFEPGLGSTDGFRQPWGFAKTCPAVAGWNAASTRFFVDQVLKPKQGN